MRNKVDKEARRISTKIRNAISARLKRGCKPAFMYSRAHDAGAHAYATALNISLDEAKAKIEAHETHLRAFQQEHGGTYVAHWGAA